MALADLDPERDFERLRPAARRRFLARARRAGQNGRVDLEAAADDAYQEAWLELQRHPERVAVEHDPAGYLAGVMWHRFHRLELRPARLESAPLEDAAGGAEPDAVVGRRETLAAVRDALAALPDRERTALLLRAEGFSNDDVAATLGVSRRIARKLAERGRARLTHELQAGDRCASIASTLRAIGLGWPVRGDRRARLDQHLAHCVTCRATVAELRREGALAAGPAVLWSGGALARVLAVLAPAGTKVAVGCVAATVCVVGVVELRPSEPARSRPAPPPVAAAPSLAGPDATDVAIVKTGWRDGVEREAERRRVQRAEATAVKRARAAAKRARVAAEQARAAGERARAAGEQARAAGEQARTAGEQARTAGEQARTAGEQAADAGRAGADRGREAADRVRDALAGIGGG